MLHYHEKHDVFVCLLYSIATAQLSTAAATFLQVATHRMHASQSTSGKADSKLGVGGVSAGQEQLMNSARKVFAQQLSCHNDMPRRAATFAFTC